MLRTKEGIQEWIFEECKNVSAMQFRFRDKEKPADQATRYKIKLETEKPYGNGKYKLADPFN
jgi:secreted Zn-dependent insulinase-like peptidase